MVEQAVRDARLFGDVADARGVEALAREHADRGVEDQTPFLFGTGRALGQGRRRVVVGSGAMQALGGTLVVDFTRYLPGAFASRELRRLGARVVRVEQPGGDPMRETAPDWHDALNAGKESVVCELPGDGDLARALARASRRDPRVVPARGRRAARHRAGRTRPSARSTARSRASASAASTSSARATT